MRDGSSIQLLHELAGDAPVRPHVAQAALAPGRWLMGDSERRVLEVLRRKQAREPCTWTRFYSSAQDMWGCSCSKQTSVPGDSHT